MKNRPWQIWLLFVLMGITGAAWVLWAFAPTSVTPGLPDWPPAVILAGAVVHFAGAWGLLRLSAWGWAFALLYMSVGAASLLSQAAASFLDVPRFLFVLESVALLAAPFLLRSRERFLSGALFAG